ncbi:MAG: ATP-binding cassette domain-containing protein [Phycisphaerales bacterium JB039]
MLRLEDVRVRYGELVALDGVSVEFPPGRTTVLIGPSGCGKSTILRACIGLLRPAAGTVEFDGRALADQSLLEVRRRIGYVIQEGGLLPHLTARGNVTLVARRIGWRRERIRARVDELAQMTRMDGAMLSRFPHELSGGQRQRVGLMRALMLDPDALLLDEPLGALDPMIRADLQEDLRALFRQLGKTVVIVTHDLAEAAYFADEIVLLESGRIAQRGRMEDLAERPATDFVRRFVTAQRAAHQLAGAGG